MLNTPSPGRGNALETHTVNTVIIIFFFQKRFKRFASRVQRVCAFIALYFCAVSRFLRDQNGRGLRSEDPERKKQSRKGWERGGRKQAARSSVRAPFFFFFFYARDASRANVVLLLYAYISLHKIESSCAFFFHYIIRELSLSSFHISSFKSQMNLSVCNIDIKHHHHCHRRYRPFALVRLFFLRCLRL